MRVVDVVARCLTRAGVDTVFGVVGSGNFTVTTSLHAQGARFVAARHENGAACMADAYARVTGRLGCVSVHQGPGFTNAMTGLTEAAKARTPLVLVAADTPAGEVRSNFYVDQDKLAEAVGAIPVRVNRPRRSRSSNSARRWGPRSRPRRWATGSSTATTSPWASAAASPRRWRPR